MRTLTQEEIIVRDNQAAADKQALSVFGNDESLRAVREASALAERDREEAEVRFRDAATTWNGHVQTLATLRRKITDMAATTVAAESCTVQWEHARGADDHITRIGYADQIALAQVALPIYRQLLAEYEAAVNEHIKFMRAFGRENGVPKDRWP